MGIMKKMKIADFCIYGDSLSDGTHGENAYLNEIKREFGIERLRNFAISASGLTEQTPNSMVSILKRQMEEGFSFSPDTPQVIFIWHGSNDWYWGSDPETFRRDVVWVTETLRSCFPDTLILWATPIFRLEAPYQCTLRADGYVNPNRNGHTLADFVQVLEDCSVRCHFPLINMHQQCHINAFNEEICLEDHVHPNAEGYRRISRVLIREIRRQWSVIV